MASTKKPALDLSTLAPDRPVIAIDGTKYEMKVPQDFGLVDQARMRKLQPVLQNFFDKGVDDCTDEEIEQAQDAMASFVEVLLLAPPEVCSNLSHAQREQIIVLFTKGLPSATEPPVKKPKRSRQTTGK